MSVPARDFGGPGFRAWGDVSFAESRDVTVTRDSKLALVIAITMILLVGVLISDHMSGATGADFDAPDQSTPRVPLQTPSDPISRITPDPTPRSPELQPNQGAPVEIAQGGGGSLLDQAFERLRSSEKPTLIGERDASETLERSGLFSTIDSGTVTLPPPSERKVDSPLKPVAEPDRPVGEATVRAEESWRTHTVVEGDSLYALARVYLGDGGLWRQIQKNNEDVLGGTERIKVGMRLRIERVRSPRPSVGQPRETAPAGPAPERTYVVLPGDALSRIASRLLGSAKRTDEIVALNGLKDADDIKAGQTLRIPVR